jgi:succinate dehydrogenase / fumarate reductase cytochrome b subunit
MRAPVTRKEPTLSWLTAALRSSVGKKFVMGVTGLFLCLFLVIHLAGNLLLFAGDAAYNDYAHKLHAMQGFLLVSQVLLYAAFAAHIYLAIVTTRDNWQARAHEYALRQSKKEPGTLISAISAENTMFITGSIILLYLILHLADFKFGLTGGGGDEAVPYDKAHYLMSQTWRAAVYVAASLFVGYHVSHGLKSAFQSLGANHPKYNAGIRNFSILFAIAITVGFVLVSLWGVLIAPGDAPLLDPPPSPETPAAATSVHP